VDEREGAALSAARAARAEQELEGCRQQRRFADAALRAISDAVVTVDLDGRITLLNPVAAHLTGWTEGESLGRPLGEVVRFADEGGAPIDVLSPDATWTVSLLRRRDGHVVLVDGSVATIVDDERNALGSVITFRNVTAAKRLTDELTHQAHHEPLTGLANRRAFESRLRRAVASAAEHGCRHALLYFDLDRFKQVNDQAGHPAGDELLRRLSATLRRQLREQDALARLGGDEFAVLLEDCTPEDASVVAEKIRNAVAGFEFGWEGQRFRIGASIGQLEFAGPGLDAGELLYRADQLCYLAKSQGRNRIVTASIREPPLSGRTASRSPRPRVRRPHTVRH